MLNKEKCKQMIQNKEFDNLYSYFEDEYKLIIDNMLDKKGIKKEKRTFIQTMILASENLDEISGFVCIIADIAFDVQKGIYTRISELMDMYPKLVAVSEQ